ncbi:MAG: 3-deoxy-D-manno-octulosonic acid transferase [Alphaproteobacteria bacterium]
MIGALATPGTYRLVSRLAGPAISFYLRRRLARGKEERARFGERLGRAAPPRPDGFLVWCHAASVGESMALLPLLDRLHQARPALSALVTSGTVTSARLLAERLPPFAVHQYVPVDRPDPVRRFLKHWRPDLALWVESELWPNLVLETARRGVPMFLVNARMSDASAARWVRYPKLIAALLAAFRVVLTQTEADAARFRDLGATVECTGNLKYDAPAPHYDAAALEALKAAIGGKPCWLAASTHDGEEAVALDAHVRLATRRRDLLTIVAPRHPERGETVVALARARGLVVARRSRGEPIAPETAVYLADTLGELGLFYSLCGVVFVGGSLVPVGGHNAIEPARLDCALIAGPDMANFTDLQTALRDAGALATVRDAASLAEAVAALLDDPARRDACATSARRVAESLGGAAERTLAHLLPAIPDAQNSEAPRRARA